MREMGEFSSEIRARLKKNHSTFLNVTDYEQSILSPHRKIWDMEMISFKDVRKVSVTSYNIVANNFKMRHGKIIGYHHIFLFICLFEQGLYLVATTTRYFVLIYLPYAVVERPVTHPQTRNECLFACGSTRLVKKNDNKYHRN